MSTSSEQTASFDATGPAPGPAGVLAADERAAAAAPELELDEFRLRGLLGQGGMGAVYLAHDTVLDREVALKLVHGRAGARSHVRFLVEARAIARLEHPNVVRIHRAATSRDGRPYLVQEFLRGRTLDRLRRPLPPRRACELALAVARGLAAAHEVGVLHRDVKPSNVMLTDDGQVKLLDFGIAKLDAVSADRDSSTPDVDGPTSAPPALEHRLSTTGELVGTPRYLAPERWRGDAATPASDVYALAVMLFELVAGRPPFAAADLEALASAVTSQPAPALIGPDVPPALAALVGRCLDGSPTRRPHLTEVITHLTAVVDELPAPIAGNPYPGLAAFDPARRADFFGRDAEVERLLAALRASPLVTVTGDSGVGKSSLCHAALLPAIAGGALGDGRRWRTCAMTPGRRPLHALAAALGPLAAALTDDLGPAAAARWARAIAPGADQGVVLLVDQLEELVTTTARTEAVAAARALAALADDVRGLRVVLAVRGDLLTRVAALDELGPAMMRSIHLVRPLDDAALRAAICSPARRRGVDFDSPAMVDELIAPVLADPATLPLLQFTLAALWESRASTTIPTAALARLGGVAAGFAGHADAVLAACSTEARLAARRMLLACVEGRARIGRTRAELCGEDPAAPTALEALVAGRILIARDQPGDDATYTLVHEALIDGWPRLRAWLNARAGEQPVRARLRAAADDWARAGRPRARLWSRAALHGADQLDELPAVERAFITASAAAARRARLAWAALALAVPVAAAATWQVGAAQDRRDRAARVAGHQATAARELAAGRAELARVASARGAAFAHHAAGEVDAGEARWAAAAAHAGEARATLARAAAALETALLLAPADARVRDDLAAVIDAQAALAEATGDEPALAELLERLARHDRGHRLAAWRRPATLRIEIADAAEIAVRPILAADGRRRPGPIAVRHPGPRLEATISPGAHQVEVRGKDGLAVVAPVLVTRGEHLDVRFALPPRQDVPAGFVVVPPGRFLTGTRYDDFFRRDFLGASPERPAETDGFLIARHEVTFGEWLAFLRALPPAERERRRPATAASDVMSVRIEGGPPFTFVLQPTSALGYRAREGEPVVFPGRARRHEVRWEQLPVTGISAPDGEAYAAWLDATGQVPGARLCRELEWERAARGADGRAYPHGDRLEPDDANIDVTYDRDARGLGPDEVGSHPASDSPFGVADLVGNVWEWVAGDDGAALQRGGGWAHGASSALSANRDVNNPNLRHAWAGLRICADLPRPPLDPGASP